MIVQYVGLSSGSFQSFITEKFVEITDKTIFDKLTNIHTIDLLKVMPKVKKKSDKQQQRLYKVRKRDERVADRAKKNIQIVIVYRRQLVIRVMKGLSKCKEMRQQYNAEWKRHTGSLPEFREYEHQCNRVKMQLARKNPAYMDNERECNNNKMARKDATYRDLVKIFKSCRVCDWMAKWIIMLRFMDLIWPRVFRRSNVGLVFIIGKNLDLEK